MDNVSAIGCTSNEKADTVNNIDNDSAIGTTSNEKSDTVNKIVFKNMNFWQSKESFFQTLINHTCLQTSQSQ